MCVCVCVCWYIQIYAYTHTQVRDLLCAPGHNEGKKFGIVAGEHGGMAVADLVRVPVTTSADIDKLMRASCVPVLYVWWVGPVCPSCVQYAPATAPPAAHTHGRGGDGDQHVYLHTPLRQAYTHKGTLTHAGWRSDIRPWRGRR